MKAKSIFIYIFGLICIVSCTNIDKLTKRIDELEKRVVDIEKPKDEGELRYGDLIDTMPIDGSSDDVITRTVPYVRHNFIHPEDTFPFRTIKNIKVK